MLFNSYSFVFFLLIVLSIHALPIPWRLRKLNLLVASYLFYAAWNPPFVVLLWISTIVDWIVAKRLDLTTAKRSRRALLFVSLGVNLGMLGFFKYGGFILANFVGLMNLLGVHFQPLESNIILPVGISFYTFQTLSYTIGIYRGSSRPWHSFLDYALYVTFFPQLVAGPIVRAVDFLPQCLESRRATWPQLSWGLSLLVLGLFEKVVLADGLLAPVVEQVYDATGRPDTIAAWTGTLAFSGQIFFDFAGYSTCAIGVGLCLGFILPTNFRFPYAALGFSDFWRRWHISLSSWLRDYVYIPLGGNRKGVSRSWINLSLTMLLGGLWHGASWTFVVWGGLHGLYLSGERLVRDRLPPAADRKGWMTALGWLITFGLVCLAWVFFRADSFGRAFGIVAALVGGAGTDTAVSLPSFDVALTLTTVAAMLSVHWFMRDRSLEAVATRVGWLARAVFIAVMLIAIVMMPGEDRAFIYFQF